MDVDVMWASEPCAEIGCCNEASSFMFPIARLDACGEECLYSVLLPGSA
jgi:hypothetical protein